VITPSVFFLTDAAAEIPGACDRELSL
jgi:hypothetical protein